MCHALARRMRINYTPTTLPPAGEGAEVANPVQQDGAVISSGGNPPSHQLLPPGTPPPGLRGFTAPPTTPRTSPRFQRRLPVKSPPAQRSIASTSDAPRREVPKERVSSKTSNKKRYASPPPAPKDYDGTEFTAELYRCLNFRTKYDGQLLWLGTSNWKRAFLRQGLMPRLEVQLQCNIEFVTAYLVSQLSQNIKFLTNKHSVVVVHLLGNEIKNEVKESVI